MREPPSAHIDARDVSTPPGDALTRVRAAWRAWVADRPWAPLVHVDQRFRPTNDQLADSAAQARGGWLYLGPGEVPTALLDAARACCGTGTRLVHDGALPSTAAIDAATDARLAWEDRFHVVASDPTLSRQRQALLSHCRHGETVLLIGPHGAGRRSLVCWAHGQLATTPLSVLDGGSHATPPGRWVLVPDPTPALAGTLQHLCQRDATPAPPPPPAASTGVRPAHPAFAPIIGRDPLLCEQLHRASLHAPHDTPVLVLGETGTGKELLARAIHDASGRSGPLVCIDLGTLSEDLAASTLFGHRRGAFTGADRPREGAFRRAHKGTLFLDELGNLSLSTQARLLRVLQEGEVLPLGADRPEPVDVRVVAATNADPAVLVAEGRFRRDLLYRLNTVVLRLPALRERRGDIPALTRSILDGLGAPPPTDAAVDALVHRPWPGNIRQLHGVLRAAAVEALGQPLRPRDLGASSLAADQRAPLVITAGEAGLDGLGLDRAQKLQLSALSLRVPGPAERGRPALLGTILASLGGRPIRGDALDLLLAWPWWGHGVELDRKLSMLRRQVSGAVDRDAVLALFPDMAAAVTRTPISLLLHPVLRADGQVRGLRDDHHAAAVLIGRATRLPPPDAADRRSRWLRATAGEGEIDLVPFPHLPELSRAHVLITRQADGLTVARVPGSALDVDVVAPGRPPVHVAAGQRLDTGPAVDIRVRRTAGEPYLRIFAFLGQQAIDDSAARLARDRKPDATRETVHPPTGRRSAFSLSPAEVALLVDIVATALGDGQPLAPALRGQLRVPGPDRERLRAYVDGPHPTQAAGRLFELPANGPLRDAMSAALAARGLDASALPARIRRAVAG